MRKGVIIAAAGREWQGEIVGRLAVAYGGAR